MADQAKGLSTVPKQETAPVAVVPKNVRELLSNADFKKELAAAMPAGVITESRFVRAALTLLKRTPDLAKCTVTSFAQCMLDCAQLGLEPGGPLQRAFLIPFRNKKKEIVECTLIVGFRGLCDLAFRSGKVMSIRAEIVCEKDDFSFEFGLNEKLEHRPMLDGDPGPWKYVYAIATMVGGAKQWCLLTKHEVLSIKNARRGSGPSPWDDWETEMAKKTAIRRLAKTLPLAAEFYEALDREDESLEKAGAIVTPFEVVGNPDADVDDEPPAQSEARDKAIANIDEMMQVIGLKFGTAKWSAIVAGAAARADVAIDAGRGGDNALHELPDDVLHEIIRDLDSQMPPVKK